MPRRQNEGPFRAVLLLVLTALTAACGTRSAEPGAGEPQDGGSAAGQQGDDAGRWPPDADGGDGEAVVEPLRIHEGGPLPNARVGEAYRAGPLRAEGGVPPVRWALRAVPTNLAWLSIDPLEGDLRGTPQSPVLPAAGFEVVATDSDGSEAARFFRLAVASCDEGHAVTCFQPSPDGCRSGEAVCAGGVISACQPKAPSDDFGHCGEACEACSAQSAERCVDGKCRCGELEACRGERPDCCVAGAARTCVDTRTDVLHCGSCGRACPPKGVNLEVSCRGGLCEYRCRQGYTACGVPDVCHDLTSDIDHCGACGKSCRGPMPPNVQGVTCAQSACRHTGCVAGFADCDGVFENGCERNLLADPDHCGACGRVCSGANASARTCVGGRCEPVCAAGFADCNPDANDGCECSLPNASPVCSAGVCTVASCAPGFGDCTVALGCETDISSDLANCGGCGRRCDVPGATESCAGGVCRMQACEEGRGNCDGSPANGCEVIFDYNKQNCGKCGNACPGAFVCIGGSCERP